jgi:hypothetical protein
MYAKEYQDMHKEGTFLRNALIGCSNVSRKKDSRNDPSP